MIQVGRVSPALALGPERLRGLGLDPYDPARDGERPAFFMGLYARADLDVLRGHRGPAIQMFCGADARNAAWATRALGAMRPRVRVLASPTLVRDLHSVGITVDIVRGVHAGDPAPFQPCPLGPRVYVYVPYERRGEYGIAILEAVAAELPDVGFYLGRWGNHARPFANALPLRTWFDHADMPNVYADCFAGLRTIARDGFPTTPVELALMGRPVAGILGYGVPWIPRLCSPAAMADFLRAARDRAGPDLALAEAARAHVIDRSFLSLDPVPERVLA